jgi:predicted acyl esterase
MRQSKPAILALAAVVLAFPLWLSPGARSAAQEQQPSFAALFAKRDAMIPTRDGIHLHTEI